ncbi:MAG TPA: 4Fe-4S binding protein [Anaerolineales bacterium]|nr:4Fe-4S binding protein [Anaerolineales bacterium]
MAHPETLPADSVLVIGGGVGGMRAAIDLAEAGIHTYLLETSPALGGRVAQLGFMFPTHDCVLCRGTSDHGFGCTRPSITPALLDHNRHPNITLLTSTDLIACDGQAGDFHVRLEQQPRFVDPARCINCGRCSELCPEERPSGFQLGLSTRKVIDKSAPRSVPNTYYLLEKTPACDGCRRCQEACPTGAIHLDARPSQMEIGVGAIILAMGFQPFQPARMPEFGYGRIPNVITSMQYERLASRSGPTEGIVRRISDGAIPRRIAWLQCVGSRDQTYPYCSSICCMYATKQAILARQRNPAAECHIFTMDERAFNKEYELYYQQARHAHDIHYTRCRISSLTEDPSTGEVILRYPGGRRHEDSAPGQGPLQESRFDLVVLAVGIRPPKDALDIARLLGIRLNDYGFCETDKFSPLATSRSGVFVSGAFATPKEIAETILDGSGAAAEAMLMLHERLGARTFSRGQPFISAAPPDTSTVIAEEAGAVVALCGCAGEIDQVVDLSAVARHAAGVPGVKRAEVLPLACLPEGQHRLRVLASLPGVNRMVIGACSHRTHESLFQRLAAESGIHPSLMELVNLREQCAWVHADDPAGATRKAAELVTCAVARLRRARPVRRLERPPIPAALVVGGGVSGMTAALAVADAGYDVHLVERGPELGGNLHHIFYVAEGDSPQRLLRDLVNRVMGHEHVQVHLRTEVVRHGGSVGDFHAVLRQSQDGARSRLTDVRHAVTILATGGVESGGSRYGLGRDSRVLRQSELEEIIIHQPERAARLRTAVMIQCVVPEGSLDYCSRVCCTNTIKNAIRLKMLNPACQVVVLYRNIITYGFREKYHLEARRRGVIFVRYTEDEPPTVTVEPRPLGSALVVRVREHVFGETLTFEPELLALSMSIQPSAGTSELARMMGVPLSREGFFMEAHPKMRPMDFADDGLYLAGMAHYPKFIEESIAHALACAGRALTILSRPSLQLGGVVAVVDPERCTGCLTCVRTCPFGIPAVRPDIAGVGRIGGSAWIDPARCQGCGTCTAECPARAIQLEGFRDEQMRVGLGAWSVPVPEEVA